MGQQFWESDTVAQPAQQQAAPARAATPAPARATGGGTVIRAGKPVDQFRTLSADEAAARGLPAGGVYQVNDTTGETKAIQNAPQATPVSAEKQGEFQKQLNGIQLLGKRIDGIEQLYNEDFKGFRLREIPDSIGVGEYNLGKLLPKSARGKADRFDQAGRRLIGDLKAALGLTGGEGNTAAEVELRYGPFIPTAADSDEVVESKLKALREQYQSDLASTAQRLGIPLPDEPTDDGNGAGGETPPTGQDVEIGFNYEAPASPFNPAQEAAYNAWHQANPNATAEQLRAFVATMIGEDGQPLNMTLEDAQGIIAARDEGLGVQPGSAATFAKPDISDVRGQGGVGETIDAGVRSAADTVTAGLASVVAAGADAITSDRTYSQAKARQDAISEYDWDKHFEASLVGAVGGGLLIPTKIKGAGRAAATQTLRSGGTREAAVAAARKAVSTQLAKEGAAYGTIHGASSYKGDVADAVAQAAVEATIGGISGKGLPAAAKAGSKIAGGVKSVFQSEPALAEQVVFKAIRADGNTAGRLERGFARADEAGVPAMLADTGENARGTLAANARAPGPGRTSAVNALDNRQETFADRVTGHVVRHLGPVANPHELADTIMTRARDEAAPLYDAAYAADGASAFADKVAPLLARPSMRGAIAKAARIAEEEGRDPTTLGFDFNEAGDVVLRRVPSWQTMDYIKRGMDDVLEVYRDKTTGKLVLDTEGKAIDNTRKSFLAAFDKANPAYGEARAAWAGPVRAIEAMNDGRRALNMQADDLQEALRGKSPAEKEMFALGVRRAMAELVESKGDTSNFVHALVGTGKKRAMLARLFGGGENFKRFIDAMDVEQAGFETYKRARQGSTTALNAADDTQLAIATGLGEAALTSGLPVVTGIRYAVKTAGTAKAKAAEDAVAKMLGETDPAKVRAIIQRFKRAEAKMLAGKKRAQGAKVAGALQIGALPDIETD